MNTTIITFYLVRTHCPGSAIYADERRLSLCCEVWFAIIGYMRWAICLACIHRSCLKQAYLFLSGVHDVWLTWTSNIYVLQFVSWSACVLVSSCEPSYCGQSNHVGGSWRHRNEMEIIWFGWLFGRFRTKMQVSSLAGRFQRHWYEGHGLCISGATRQRRSCAMRRLLIGRQQDVVRREDLHVQACSIHRMTACGSVIACVCCRLVTSVVYSAICWCRIKCRQPTLQVILSKLLYAFSCFVRVRAWMCVQAYTQSWMSVHIQLGMWMHAGHATWV